MNAAELITKAADLIETTGWTQGYSARDENGDPVFANNERAVCFCAHGALSITDNLEYSQAYYVATRALNERTDDAPYTGVEEWPRIRAIQRHTWPHEGRSAGPDAGNREGVISMRYYLILLRQGTVVHINRFDYADEMQFHKQILEAHERARSGEPYAGCLFDTVQTLSEVC